MHVLPLQRVHVQPQLQSGRSWCCLHQFFRGTDLGALIPRVLNHLANHHRLKRIVDMRDVPCHQNVNPVHGGNRDMQRVFRGLFGNSPIGHKLQCKRLRHPASPPRFVKATQGKRLRSTNPMLPPSPFELRRAGYPTELPGYAACYQGVMSTPQNGLCYISVAKSLCVT